MDLSNFLKVFLICFLLLQQNTLALVQILSGRRTTIDKVPYMVQIYNKEEFKCGGSLISDYFVVTAGHCLVNIEVNNFVVVGGATKLTDNGVKSSITKVFLHEEFNKKTLHMDVALMKLKNAFINIPKSILCKPTMRASTMVSIFGWGVIFKDDKTPSENLRTDKFPLMDHAECVKASKGEVTESLFCTMEYKRGIHRGDSGGPVLCDGCFCGIASWFFEFKAGMHISAYTNLAHVMQFIDTTKESNA